MKVEVYLYNHFEKISYDILKLLENNNITFSVKAYDSDMPLEKVSKDIGEKVKRLPQVIIDGERVGIDDVTTATTFTIAGWFRARRRCASAISPAASM